MTGTVGAMGTIEMEDWTAGDWGGLMAGAVGLFATVAKGLAWTLNWNEARSTARERRMEAWEASLTAREKQYREEVEQRIDMMQDRVEHLSSALRTVTSALRGYDPASPALAQAEALLDSMKF